MSINPFDKANALSHFLELSGQSTTIDSIFIESFINRHLSALYFNFGPNVKICVLESTTPETLLDLQVCPTPNRVSM